MNPSNGDGRYEIYDTLGTSGQRTAYARPQPNIRPSDAQILNGQGTSSHNRALLQQLLMLHAEDQRQASNASRSCESSLRRYIERPNLDCGHPLLAESQQALVWRTDNLTSSRAHLQNPGVNNIHADQRQASSADCRHPLLAESQQALVWHTDNLTSSRAHLQNPGVNNIHADQRQASSADWSYDASSGRYIERENLNSRDQLYAELQPSLVQRINQLASAVGQLQLQNRRPDNRYADQRQDYNALSAADWSREAREQQGLPDASIDPRRPDALLAVAMQAHRAIHPTVGRDETIARTSAWYEQQGRRSDEIIQADQRRTWNMDVPIEYWTDPGALCVYCGDAIWGQDLDFDTRQCGHYQHRACYDRYNYGVACRACAAGTRVFPFEF